MSKVNTSIYAENPSAIYAHCEMRGEAGAEIDLDCARAIAGQWHNGQASAFYSFASCGHYDVHALRRELSATIERDYATASPADRRTLDAFGTYMLSTPCVILITTTFNPDQVVDGELGPDASTDLDFNVYESDGDETAVEWALKMIRDAGLTSPSAWSNPRRYPGPNTWYSNPDGPQIVDYRTGEHEECSAHLEGFSPAQLREVWERVTA